MNPTARRLIRRLSIGVLLLAGVGVTSATTVVFSNLKPDSAGNAARLVDSHGNPLASGCWIRLGHFGNLSSPEITALSQQGPTTLLASFTPLGEPAAIGTGTSSTAGRVEFAASTALALSQGGLHVVVFNAASPAASSEVLVAALPGVAPADDASGLSGYLAVHLEDATPVVGSLTANGLATAEAAGGFESWMSSQNVATLPPEQLLPSADADHDGASNLIEYALGSLAGDAASRANTALVRDNGVMRLRFLGRNGDSKLHLIVETSSTLGGNTWTIAPKPVVEASNPPSPAPSGCRWLEVDLPLTGDRLFARVRATLDP